MGFVAPGVIVDVGNTGPENTEHSTDSGYKNQSGIELFRSGRASGPCVQIFGLSYPL